MGSPDDRSIARRSLTALLWFCAGTVLGAPAATGRGQATPDAAAGTAAATEAARFERRTAFVPTAVDAAPIVARRAGPAAEDVHALPVQALGDVEARTVADVGAGRGRHVSRIAQGVGAAGRLFVTEVSDERCGELRALVEGAGLGNVRVVRGTRGDVGLPEAAVDVVLLSDVYGYVGRREGRRGRRGQDRHAFLNSLHRALVPGGEVVVTYVTSSDLRHADTRRELLELTRRDFHAYGFEPGRWWVLDGPQWPVHVLEFRSPADGPAPIATHMGREIARTMHWAGADWLVRPEREEEERTSRMLDALDVRSGQTVADFGCGNGYHTLELARRAGPQGRVFGVDVQPEMLALLDTRATRAGLENVVPIQGSALDAPLPAGSCDLILLADVYHELSHPVPMLAVIRRALKPDGRVALLEFRGEDPDVPIKPEHKMTRAQVVAELEAGGLRLDEEFAGLPWQHLLFFRADAAEAPGSSESR